MIQEKRKAVIWVDVLGFSTIIKIIKYRHDYNFIYYANLSTFFSPFVDILAKALNKKVEQINDLVEPEHMINGVNIFEEIQRRIFIYLAEYTSNIHNTARTNLDKDIFNEYIKEASYPLIFRPVELLVLAEVFGNPSKDLLLLKKSPLQEVMKKNFVDIKLYFYTHINLIGSGALKRDNYVFDNLNNAYLNPKRNSAIKVFFLWFLSMTYSLLFYKKCEQVDASIVNIGVDLFQPYYKKNKCNDLFWLEGSKIARNKFIVFAYENYDCDSLKGLIGDGVTLAISVERIFLNFSYYLKNKDNYIVATPSLGYFSSTLRMVILTLFFTFRPGYDYWIDLQRAIFVIRSRYWEDIYKNLHIRLLWSMADIEKDKVSKAQSLRWLEGVYLGSHWSNFPVHQNNTEKCYDIFFPWSDHFVTNIFSKYPYKAVFEIGYPTDHSFSKNREASVMLKDNFKEL